MDNMDEIAIIAKWKKVGRILILSITISTFILFVCVGLFASYENSFTSREQMVLVMMGLGTMCSLILACLYMWMILWKLEVKDNEVIVSGFLKRKRYYSLSELTIEKHGTRIDVKSGRNTIARMSYMIENCDEVVLIIENVKGVKGNGK